MALTSVTVLSGPRACTVIHPNVTIKTFHRPDDSVNELWFYRRVPWACPTLIHAEPGVLVTETLPVAGNNPDYQPAYELYQLLARLQGEHIHHRDVHCGNIVAGADGPKLIDWETGIYTRKPSYDLWGPGFSRITVPDIHASCGPQWWNSPDENSIRNRWNVDIYDLMMESC